MARTTNGGVLRVVEEIKAPGRKPIRRPRITWRTVQQDFVLKTEGLAVDMEEPHHNFDSKNRRLTTNRRRKTKTLTLMSLV